MKRQLIILAGILFCLPGAGIAQVPQLINYQGRVTVGGTNFDGIGQFKFALVNGSGGVSFWSNDGSSSGGSQPASTVPLTVSKGSYSVLLGDTTLSNMTAVIPVAAFTNSDVRLRVWFNDGVTGFQQLSPDQRLAAVGYAMTAANLLMRQGPNSSVLWSVGVGNFTDSESGVHSNLLLFSQNGVVQALMAPGEVFYAANNLSVGGKIHANGTIDCDSDISANGLNISGTNVNFNHNIHANGDIMAEGNIAAQAYEGKNGQMQVNSQMQVNGNIAASGNIMASGNILAANFPGGSVPNGIKEFGTGPSTFHVPANVSRLFVEVWGAGGGGGFGGEIFGPGFGGGGGGGGAFSCEIINVTPGSALTITVGAGGASGQATAGGDDGGDGGDSSIALTNGTVLIVSGGGKGGFEYDWWDGLGGAGGTPDPNAAIRHAGSPGDDGTSSDPAGAAGGGSTFCWLQAYVGKYGAVYSRVGGGGTGGGGGNSVNNGSIGGDGYILLQW